MSNRKISHSLRYFPLLFAALITLITGIWQEIHLGSFNSLLQCKDQTVLWRHIRNAIQLLDYPLPKRYKTKVPVSLLHQRRRFASAKAESGTMLLLEGTTSALYSVPHDRIYALLGIMLSNFVPMIDVDYTLPLARTFQNVCLAELTHNLNLGFLNQCRWSETGRLPDLPSWVPDWSVVNPSYIRIGHNFPSGESCSRVDCRNGSQLVVDGVLCGTLDIVGEDVASELDFRPVLAKWEEIARSTDPRWKETLVETLMCSETEEAIPEWNHPTFKQCWEAYLDEDSEPLVSPRTWGRTIFRCCDGRIGLCHPEARKGKGDVLVVLLGGNEPMILRKAPSGQDLPTYIVVGPAFVTSLDFTEALLGPVPSPYRARWELSWRDIPVEGFLNTDDGTCIYEDPRLGPLPEGWEYVFDFKPEELEARFFCLDGGELTMNDPRLSPEELRKRGTRVEEFVLV